MLISAFTNVLLKYLGLTLVNALWTWTNNEQLYLFK